MAKNYLAQDVKSVKVEKPCNKGRTQNDKNHIIREFQNVGPELVSSSLLLLSTCKMIFTLCGSKVILEGHAYNRMGT